MGAAIRCLTDEWGKHHHYQPLIRKLWQKAPAGARCALTASNSETLTRHSRTIQATLHNLALLRGVALLCLIPTEEHGSINMTSEHYGANPALALHPT